MENVHDAAGAACDTVTVCPPIVSVPVRAAPVLAATPNDTVPLPVPDAPLVTVSHAALAVAVHAHVPCEAVTVTEAGPPASATLWAAGAIVIVHGGGGAACVIVNVRPAAAIVATRDAVPVFAATVNATVPLPVPAAPDVIVIQAALVVAVHVQLPAEAVTAIDPDPPASATFWDDGEIENVQAGGGAAACAIVNVLPATTIVAVRAAPVLAAMR